MRKGMFATLVAGVLIGLHSGWSLADSLKPLHFDTVAEMIDDQGDYSEEKGTFAVLSREPLHIQLTASVMSGDPREQVSREVRRAALYGVYRTMVHTDAAAVQVTSRPGVITLNPYSMTLMKTPSLQITVTRAQALKAARAVIGDAAILEPEKVGAVQFDNWGESFEKAYTTDDGQKALLDAIKAAGGDLVNNG